MPKNCDKCGEGYVGFGTTCSTCRKLGSQSGSSRQCPECGIFFQGFGAKCVDCGKKDSNNCNVCGKSAYPMERITIEGISFHPTCFKCHRCHAGLSASNFCKTDKGTFYCQVHFEQLFKLRGRYSLESLGDSGSRGSSPPPRSRGGSRGSSPPPRSRGGSAGDEGTASQMMAAISEKPSMELEEQAEEEEDTLRDVMDRLRQQCKGFVHQREEGIHVLFSVEQVQTYFDGIREGLRQGSVGTVLRGALGKGLVTETSDNRTLWDVLMQSLKINGIDFEHSYNILPGTRASHTAGRTTAPFARAGGADNTWSYSFNETIVLSHTMLLAPAMQHYGPLLPTLDLGGKVKKFIEPAPLLVVGMIGDCVKGNFWGEIEQKASEGDPEAERQRKLLLNPERLQQKLRSVVSALHAARRGKDLPMKVDAVLVGAGAFGGSAKVLAQPFVDSLKQMQLQADDKVNFFAFPPPKPEELSLDDLDYTAELNPASGLAGAPAERKELRVLVAGFDPLTIAPHGVRYRVVSAEGQVCHATDFLQRITGQRGRFVGVDMPKCEAWASPAAFFAEPQKEEFIEKQAYETVRFVPDVAFRAFPGAVKLAAQPVGGKLVWNGDSFEGFWLSADGKFSMTWGEAMAAKTGSQADMLEEAPLERVKLVLNQAFDDGKLGEMLEEAQAEEEVEEEAEEEEVQSAPSAADAALPATLSASGAGSSPSPPTSS